MDDRRWPTEETARYRSAGERAIYAKVSSKGMPGHRVGRFWKFKRDEVDAWVLVGGAGTGEHSDDR